MNAQWFSAPARFREPGVPPGEDYLRQGQAYLRRGWFVEAEASLTRAAGLLEGHPGVWAMLGQALVGLDQSLRARDCLERSLVISNAQPVLWNNLGALLAQAGETTQALAAFRQALAIQPDFSPARRSACSALYALGEDAEAEAQLPDSSERCLLQSQALRERGDLEAATEAYRQAITRLDLTAAGRVASHQLPYSADGATKALLAARERLAAAGIEFFLMAGTLLGVVRNGELLPHDKDLDLGVAWEVDRGHLIQALCAEGLFTVPWDQGILPPERPWYRAFYHSETGTRLDIFFLRPEAGTLLSGFDCLPVPILCRLQAFGLRNWSWLGLDWKVPDPPEEYLAQIYGAGWGTPDPHFDTILSNPSRTPECVPLVVCMSYLRLFSALQAGQWARAKALIAQIQARSTDPFLDELRERIHQFPSAGDAP